MLGGTRDSHTLKYGVTFFTFCCFFLNSVATNGVKLFGLRNASVSVTRWPKLEHVAVSVLFVFITRKIVYTKGQNLFKEKRVWLL